MKMMIVKNWTTLPQIGDAGEFNLVTLNVCSIAYLDPFDCAGVKYYEVRFGSNDSLIIDTETYETILSKSDVL